MAAIEQEIIERIRKLNPVQQQKVLAFVHGLEQPEAQANWEQQPWTDDEIQQLTKPKRKSFKEMVEWLEANPPTEPWGDLRDDEDVAEYVHRMRRQSTLQLEDPEGDE